MFSPSPYPLPPKERGNRTVISLPILRITIPRYVALLIGLSLVMGTTVRAQHDAHRNTVRYIARGQYDRAEKTLNGVAENPASLWSSLRGAYARAGETVEQKGDRYARLVLPENFFVQAMLAGSQGDAEAALRHARSAVEAGLPFERLLAGPRCALAPLHQSAAFQQWATQQARVLIHGPMLGHVTADGASFWVRTAHEAEVSVEVVEQGGKVIASGRGRTGAERDYTVVVRIEGLEPDTRYSYRLAIDGRTIPVESSSFRTHPEPGTPGRYVVAYGACAGYVVEHERMWETIQQHDPRALLLLGDNVYIDDPEHVMTQNYCYYRRHSQPQWRQLIAGRGVYAIWDDHDFGMDDCFGGPEIDVPAWKRPVWEVFRQNWNNPAYGGGQQQPGCWFDFYLGDIHFIMLDGRYYREEGGRQKKKVENPSMLGPVQLAWLKETLKHSRGTFKILASPVPWAPGVKGGPPGGLDTWDGFPGERDAIYNFVYEQGISGVALLSGDRHRSDARRITRPNGYDLYDLLSAGLTNYHTHPVVETPGLLFGYNEKNSFALLHFDTLAEDPTLTYEIVNIDNQSIWSLELTLSQLTDQK
jgi:alkaline phosphatase D